MKKKLMSTYEMIDLRFLHYFCGIQVLQLANGIVICTPKYALDLVKRFHMEDCKPCTTPF
jgi:hypothetical protein